MALQIYGPSRAFRSGAALLLPWTLEITKYIRGEDEILGTLAAMNEAEYHGLRLCLDLLKDLGPRHLVICEDSNMVIRQVRSEIDCKVPGLTLLRQRALDRLRTWPDLELVHIKQDSNGSADSLSNAALQRTCGIEVDSDQVTLNRLDEILVAKIEDEIAHVSAVTTRPKARSGARTGSDPDTPLRELQVVRIQQAQDEESCISGLKKYLDGEAGDLTQKEANVFGSIGMNYEVNQSDLLFSCPSTKEAAADRDKLIRLENVSNVNQANDNLGFRSPGNLSSNIHVPDHCHGSHTLAPKITQWDTDLLSFEDLFSGYVIVKAIPSRSAQTIAETYEECVFRKFGASEVTRHERDSGFMSNFFKSFNKSLGRRQRAPMVYRPQTNGSSERMVQTTTGALKTYVQDLDQRDWDEYAERLIFTINTARDRIRGETPFYMVNGWNPMSTLAAVVPGVLVGMIRIQEGGDIVCKNISDKLENRLTNVCAKPSRIKLTHTMIYRCWIECVKDMRRNRRIYDTGTSALQDQDPVDRISDMRTGTRTRYGRIYREFLVNWRGYKDPTWVDEANLNCSAFPYEFLRCRTNRNRFGMTQSHEEP
ncbi:LOW QUALITY PROTEIN: reverse transcriptase [Phytophthora megakarya]|uniref:Reverse transcriptase n=1 Tax=Phytophthora megakarya TaxID=4795 RepID=A0A225VKP3_9STRA|nr:LOW QUALITY PROTEIN: reverse transcriptase [Phytophthora megakarya]